MSESKGSRHTTVYCTCGHAKSQHTKAGCRYERRVELKGSGFNGWKKCECEGFKEVPPAPEPPPRPPFKGSAETLALLLPHSPSVHHKTSWDDHEYALVTVTVAVPVSEAEALARAVNGGPIE